MKQLIKDTELGPLPHEWGIMPLGEVREFLQYGTSAKCDYTPKGNPVIRIPNVVDGAVLNSDLKWCHLSEKEVESLLLEKGDVLFIRTNGVRERVGTCAVYEGVPPRALFASYLIRARLKADELNPHYLQYFTSSAQGIAQLGGQASPAADGKFNVNTKTIDSVLVPLPQIREQEKVAMVLRKVQRAIQVEDELVATASELKQSTMRQLFTHGLRGEQQKETEIGRMPKNWELKELAEVALLIMGQSPDGSSYNVVGKGVPLINGPVEFSAGPLGLTLKTKFTTEPTKFCEANDLILCVRGSTTGRTNVAASRACIGRGVAAIRAREDQGFLNQYIVSIREKIFSMGTGSTFPNISGEQVKGLKIPAPHPEEQKEVADILQTLDRKISIHERKRTALSDLFQTLLHQLMTAQIRVDKLDIDTSEVAALIPVTKGIQ